MAEAPARCRSSLRRRLTRGWLVTFALAVLLPRAAFAQGDNADELARRHFESGAAYLEESDYDNALRAFQKAYELSKRPEILINIATVQERRADIDGAISALKQYLEVAPNGEHAETVRLRIQNLEKRRPAPAEAPPPPPVSAPPPLVTPPPNQPAPLAPIESERPNRVPAFIALGVGVAAGAGALVTGLIAKAKYDDLKSSCSPHCTDSELSGSRSLALTSTLLTGVAIAGAGMGITLLVIGKPTEASPHAQLTLSPTPGGAAARAQWRF